MEALRSRLQLAELQQGKVYSVRSERGYSAIVVLTNAGPRAYEARCPHMGADLTQASCYGPANCIACPWHGYRFDAETGLIAENPNEKAMQVLRVSSPNFDPDVKPPFRLRQCDIELANEWLYVK